MSMFLRRNERVGAYVQARRENRWRENSLAMADEDITGNFDWKLVRRFGPYLARYRGSVWLSVILMLAYTALNLANPFLIGVAIDDFISRNDLTGLAWISVALLGVNIAMWQAQYWQIWTMSWAGEQMLYNLSADMFSHLQRLALSF